MRRQQQDYQSRALDELSSLVLSLIRSPPSSISTNRRSYPSATGKISPAGYASLLLGISMALMLCGSVTFFIGFLLMPWVLGLVMIFYVVGIVSYLSMLGRAIFCHAMAPIASSKEIPDWKLL